KIAAAGVDRMLRVWNVTPAGGALARSAFAHEGTVLRLVFSPDGRTLLSSGEDRRVKLWAVATLTERRVLERQPDWAAGLAYTPDAKRLVVGRFDGSLALYDAGTGSCLVRLLPGPMEVRR